MYSFFVTNRFAGVLRAFWVCPGGHGDGLECLLSSGKRGEEGDAAGHPKVMRNSNIIVLMSKLIGHELDI
ncbi:hypothetical protein C7401_1508 [Paraburkholderia unamae]|nr:hypothetical protein C7401_1508 [Paraburkholderia unamae]